MLGGLLRVHAGFAIALVLMPCLVFGQAGWRDVLPPLTDGDFDLIARVARVDMAGRPVGTRLEWRNEDSGNQGSVELIDRFDREQRECRTVRHDIDVKRSGPWQKTLTICQQADGDWRAAPSRQQTP